MCCTACQQAHSSHQLLAVPQHGSLPSSKPGLREGSGFAPWVLYSTQARLLLQLLAYSCIHAAAMGGSQLQTWHLTSACGVQILDWKRFKPGQALQAGLFWVAEQIPHLIEAADMTEVLAYGYWPSYNVPYFAEVQAFSCKFLEPRPPVRAEAARQSWCV